MRVVAVLPMYPPKSRVGAFLATHELLADLARRGHDVTACRRMENSGVYTFEGVNVRPGRSNRDLDSVIRDADVVVSHVGDDGVASRIARKWGRPLVRMVHGHDPTARKKLAHADLAVFNSHHLADETGWDGRQIVVHPPLRKIIPRKPGNRVTLVNLSHEKGAELFLRLAWKRPALRFLGVKGGWGLQLTELPIRVPANVEIVGPTEAMSDVYACTRILLMPSERETWGMCALEASQSGIPTIAHPTAGLLESMGDAAVYADRDDEAAWLAQIDRLGDYQQWEEASHRARAHVAQLDPQADLDRFADAIESLVSVAA